MRADDSRRLDSGDGRDRLNEAAREGKLPGGGAVVGVGVNLKRGKVGRIEVDIDVENAVEALAEESGGSEQDDGKGQLDDNQAGAETSPRAGGTACSGGQAGAQVSAGEARQGAAVQTANAASATAATKRSTR